MGQNPFVAEVWFEWSHSLDSKTRTCGYCMIPHNPAVASVLHRSLFQGAIRPDGNKHDAECCVSG
jgi:hypothetical protein